MTDHARAIRWMTCDVSSSEHTCNATCLPDKAICSFDQLALHVPPAGRRSKLPASLSRRRRTQHEVE